MKYSSVATLFLILCSCSQPRYIYNPPARNLHYFTEKGEGVVSASWSTGPSRNYDAGSENYNHGADIQTAYAVSQHWAITAAFHQRRERDNITNYSTVIRTYSDITYKRSGWEFGGSYFIHLDNQQITFFYVDGGIGLSRNQLDDLSIIDSVNLQRYFNNKSARFFAQPGIYTGSKNFRFNLGLRFQYSRFSHQETNYLQPELVLYSLDGLNDIMTYEPYFAFRIGIPSFPWIKADMQVGTASINKGFYIRNSYATFGLSFYPFARK